MKRMAVNEAVIIRINQRLVAVTTSRFRAKVIIIGDMANI